MAKIPPGQIQLESLDLVKAEVERLRHPAEMQPLEIELGFEYQTSFPDDSHAIATGTIRIFPREVQAPFRISVTFEMRASVALSTDSNTLREWVQGQAVGLLIPYFRETVATLSGRTGYPTLLLPPLNYQTLLNLQP
jgi:preprotein translocase subunit SecB